MNFEDVKQLSDGRYFARVSDRTTVQLNGVVMTTNFADSDSVTLQLPGKCLSKIKDAENSVVTYAVENSTKWFGKELAQKTITAAFTGDSEVMNVSKSQIRGKVITRAFDHNKNQMDPNDIAASTMCDVVIEMTGVWFLKKTFGIVWKIVQMRMRQPPKHKYYDEYMFQDEDENSSDEAEDDVEDYA